MPSNINEIRQKRLEIERCIRGAHRTIILRELDELIALYEKEIRDLGGEPKIKADEYRSIIKRYYREMESFCDEVVTATDPDVERMYEKVFPNKNR